MPDGNTRTVPVQQRNVPATERFVAELDAYAPNLADALPAHVSVERFKRVLVMAVASNPDLLHADRRSLFTSAVRCAVDGLVPDGREAALVVYNTKVKRRDPNTGIDREVWVQMVQLMPMIAGIRKRMRNSGEVISATADAVFSNDRFRYVLGDNGFIEHEPPPLGQDRGDVIGAYAIIRLKNGEVIRDVVDKGMIEAARAVSRSPNSPMWKNFYSEGAKKVVLRRASKQAPLSADIERLLLREDDDESIGHEFAALPDHRSAPEPEPERVERLVPRHVDPPEDTRPQFAVIDLDGVESVFVSAARAGDALRAILEEAARDSLDRLAGTWEDNQPLLAMLESTGNAAAAQDLAVEFARLHDEAKAKAAPKQQKQQEPDRGASERRDSPGAGGNTRRAGPHPGDSGPKRAEASDPERKPPEAADGRIAVDGAGNSSEANARQSDPAAGRRSRVRGEEDGQTRASAAGAGGSPAAVAQEAPQAHEEPEPSDGAAEAEQPDSGQPPAVAAGDEDATAEDEPQVDDAGRPKLFIPLPLSNGKPNLRVWTVALFIPKLRRQRDGRELAFLLGDNAETLEACRVPAALSRDDLADLNAAIEQQWKVVDTAAEPAP